MLLPLLWLATKLDRNVFGLHSLYVWRWLLLLQAYVLNPLDYNTLRSKTWIAISLATLFWLAGASTMHRSKAVRLPLLTGTTGLDPSRYLHFTYAVFGLGTALFALYAYHVSARFGVNALIAEPQALRIAMAAGHVPLGFHFFYFYELVPSLSLWANIKLRLSRGNRWALQAIMAISFVGLLGTTARTNVTKAILLAFFVWVASRPKPLSQGAFLRRLAPLAIGAVLLFLIVGGALGKNAVGFALGGGTDSALRSNLLLVYHYNAAQLPTLDMLLHDPNVQHTYGAYTLRPVAQIAGRFFAEYSAPSHIGEYYNVPQPFNVATHLDVMYKDFGLLGVYLLSFLFGLATGAIHRIWWTWRERPGPQFIFALWAAVVFASTSAAAYIKVNYWLQALLVIILLTYADEARSSRGLVRVGGHRAP